MSSPIKAIIGLGNLGSQYAYTRHNIGFRIIDALAEKYAGIWQSQPKFEKSTVTIDGEAILLIKPQTYMNNSGEVIPYLKKQGIKAENILVVHDELEKPFGKVSTKQGGSARGHNGLKSIIEYIGPDFYRARIGIGRPENREDVPRYVLENFAQSQEDVEQCIQRSVALIENFIIHPE